MKNVPRGYDREHPMADYLKFKSWYLEYPVSNPVVEDTCLLYTSDAADE